MNHHKSPAQSAAEPKNRSALAKKLALGSGVICLVGIGAYLCLFLLMQWI